MELNERKRKIDKFLKDTFAKVKDSGFISLKMIYHELIKYGVSDKYSEVDFSKEIFPSLINKNNQRNKKYGISNNGYVDYENFDGNFCIFSSDDILRDGDPVKLYVAWEPEYVCNYVDLIIDFMVKNNISYYLKVSKTVRNDMVTIRISDIEDAYRVVDFINNNLQRGNMDLNPFCMTKGIVGLAVDNYNSYNSRVANLIGNYYECKISLDESNVGYEDFVNYVSYFKYVQTPDKSVRNNPVFLNEIKDLIYKAITNDNINVYEEHYYSVFGNKKKKRKCYNVFDKMENQKQGDNLLVEILILFIKTTIEKHGRDFTINGLFNYLTFGTTQGLSRITDSNGINSRDLLNNIDRNQIINILKNKYRTSDMYQLAMNMVDDVISNNMKVSSDNKGDKLSVFLSVTKDTYQKYGYEHAIMAITNFLTGGYMNNFTRKSFDGNESRDLLKTVDYNDIKKRLREIYAIDDIGSLARFFMDDYVIDGDKPKSK